MVLRACIENDGINLSEIWTDIFNVDLNACVEIAAVQGSVDSGFSPICLLGSCYF